MNAFPVMRAVLGRSSRFEVTDSVTEDDIGAVWLSAGTWRWSPAESLSDRNDLPGELPSAEDAARVLWRYWYEDDPAAK